MAVRLFRRPLAGIPLRWVLVVPFVVQTVGAVALVGYLSYRSGQQTVESLANQLMEQTANRVRDRLENRLQIQQQAVAVNHQAWQQGILNLQDSAQLQTRFWQQVNLSPALTGINFADSQGNLLGYMRIQSQAVQTLTKKLTGEDLPIGTRLFVKSRTGNPSQRDYFLVDERGQPKKLIYTAPVDARQTPWFEYAKTVKQQTWSPIYVYRVAPILGLSALASVDHANSDFLGVFSSDISLSDISSFLNKLNFSPSGQVFIMEQSGNLIATSTSEAAFRSPVGSIERLSAVNSQDLRTREIAQQLSQQADHLQRLTSPQQLSLMVDRQRHFVQITPYRDNYGLDWFIVTVVPESDFTGTIDTNNAKTAFLSWLTLFVATGLGILTSRWITNPILRLSQASRALAQGEWQQSLQEDSPIAELKTLTTSFNQTAEQLQRSFDRTKLALYESQDKFAKIFRTSPDVISIVNLHDGTYVEVNDQFVQATGYSREEVIGHPVQEVNLLADAGQELKLGELLQTGQPIRNFEIKLRTKAGEVLTGLMSSELIDLEGQRCVLSVFKDVSDRQRAEAALRQSEMALQEAQRVARVGSWEYNLVTETTVWSKELYRIHQCDPDQPPPSVEELANRLHPEDRLYYQAFGEQLIQGRSVEQDFRLRMQDGSLRYLAVKGEPVFNHQGDVIRLVGTVMDVTDRKQLELALEASRAQLNNVLNSAIAAITRMHVLPDCTWQVQHVSAGSEFISGYIPEELIACPNLWTSRILPEDWQAVEFQVFEDIFAERTGTYEYQFRHKDGSWRWFSQANSSHWDITQNCWVVTAVVTDISDRKQAEQALRKSEARFQKVTDAAPGEIYILVQHPDGAYEFEYMSPACRDIQELEPAQILQDPMLSFEQVHPDDRAGMYARAAESAATLQPFSHEWRLITPSGRIKWVQASARPERRDHGDIAWYGVVVDITERKQTEADLQQAIQQIDSHFENSPLAIVQWDRNYQVLRWSKQAERIFGWTTAEIIHRSWVDWNFVYEPDLELVNIRLAPLLDGSASNISLQNRNYTKYGQVITCQWYTSAVFDETGNLISMLSFAQDISDRLQAELELTKAHDLREAIFNESTDAIFLVAPPPNTVILDCNQCAVEMFEVECKEDLIGIEGNTLQKTQFIPEDLAKIATELIQKGYWSQEIEYVTKKGRVFWGNLAAKPIQVGDQTMQLVRLTDISDRHELDRIKDEFISIVSHELRTPLTAIRGSLGILETGILSEEPETAHHMLEVAVRNSDRLVRLVNDILDLERLESGKVQLVMEPCQVSDLMEMALEGVQAIATEANVTLQSTPIDIQVCASPDAIVQALTNLLGNAIKFSSPSSMVWLSAEIAHGDRGFGVSTHAKAPIPHILFSIKDQGRGIPTDKLDNIFGRFQQVDVSDARQKGGTGLGLAICKSIVQQHGGQIWAESVVGQGSTFYFTLPLGDSQESKENGE